MGDSDILDTIIALVILIAILPVFAELLGFSSIDVGRIVEPVIQIVVIAIVVVFILNLIDDIF